MKNALINWAVIGAAFFAALVLILYSNGLLERGFISEAEYMSAGNIPKIPEQELAFVEIDFGNGKVRKFSGEMRGVYNLDFALRVLAQTADLKIEHRAGQIDKISSVGNASGFWNIYRNGALQKAPLEKLTLAAGDRYLFRYEQK